MRKSAIAFLCILFISISGISCAAADIVIVSPETSISVYEGYNLAVEASASAAVSAELRADGKKICDMTEENGVYRCVWENVPRGVHSITAAAYDAAGSEFVSAPVEVTAESYGYRRIFRQNFDDISLSNELAAASSGNTVIDDNLTFGQYYYSKIETENGALHITRTAAENESFTAKYASVFYSGEGVDCYYSGRLGRSMYLAYEIDITPMQTNVAFMPLSIACSTTKSGTVDLLTFSNSGQILLLKNKIGTYNAGTQYRIRVEFDLQEGLLDCRINGERVASRQPFTVIEGFQSTNLYSLRTSFEGARGKNAEFYVDNICLEQFIRPQSKEVVTVEPGGEYPTISAGIAALRTTGGTVLVKKGTYAEDVTVGISGGDFDKLKIVGEEGAVLKGSIKISKAVNVSVRNLTLEGGAVPLYTKEELEYINSNRSSLTSAEIKAFRNRENAYKKDAVTIGGRGCEVIGCTVKNFLGTAVNISGANAYVADNYFYNCAGFVNTGNGAVIENNEMKQINVFNSNCGAGDVFRVFGTDIVIRNNYYHGTKSEYLYRPLPGSAGDYYAHADFLQSYDNNACESGNVLIENNVFIGFCHQAIMLENGTYGASKGIFYIHDWTVRNNIFSGFASWGVCGGKPKGGIPNMKFYNNLFDCEKAYYGLAMNGIGGSAEVYNNIFIGKGILAGGGSEIISKNNALINAEIKGDVNDSGSLILGSEAFEGFVSYTQGNSDNDENFNDFHLKADSLFLNKGVYVDTETDIEGNDRITGNAADIGPYEYSAGAIPPAVKIVSPKNGYSVKLGTSVSVDTLGTNVTLYADSEETGSLWKPDAAGIYTLRAISGKRSDSITVTVYPEESWETAAGGIDYSGSCKVSLFEKTKPLKVITACYADGVLSKIFSEALSVEEYNKVYTLSAQPEGDEVRIFVWKNSLSPAGKAVTVRRNSR